MHHTSRSAIAISFSIVVAVFLCVLGTGGVAIADVYSDSGHGSTAYGVNRSGTPDDELRYHVGSCAHCHDTYDDSVCGVNDLMLFKTEYFCIWCHKHPDTSYQVGMPYQGCYSYRF